MRKFYISICILFAIILVQINCFSADYYWVNGTGNWSEFSSHWATTSGGTTFHTSVPTATDNVYFDSNSFSASGQVVTVDVPAQCNNMTWTGVSNNPDFSGFSQLNINGSLTLDPNMTLSYNGTINFTSSNPGNTIYTAGQTLNGISFSCTGDYTLMDDVSLSWSGMTFNSGTLTTNDHDITSYNGSFYSNGINFRTLNLGASTLTFRTWSVSDGTNFTLNAGTSHIIKEIDGWEFLGGGLTYNDVTIKPMNFGPIFFGGSNSFNTLTIEPGVDVRFEQGSVQTTSNFIANGNVGEMIFLHSAYDGTQVFINQTTSDFCGDWLNIQDMNVGTVTFYAGENSNDLGNNTGWTWSGVTANDQYPAPLCEDVPGGGTAAGVDLTALESSIDGGNGYTHTWFMDENLTTPVATPTNVTVSDGQMFYDEVDNGTCTNVATVTYTVYSKPDLTFIVTDVLCNVDNTGAIDMTINGGTAPFNILWSNTETTEDITNLVAGTYTVTVTDVNSCSNTGSQTVTEPSAISIDSESSTNITCNGLNDGTITVTASGGSGTLSYDIGSGGQATGNFTGLSAGTYTVTVTDGNGCTATSSAMTITEPSAISIDSESSTDITCNGLNDGTITVTASGGSGTLSYDIGSGGQATGNFTGLSAGTYTVTVTDGNGCTATSSAMTITEPSAIALSETHTDVTTCGGSDGTIDLTVSGGIPGYSYSWTGPSSFTATTEDLTGLIAGAYIVTVTDANLCENTLTVSISEVGAPTVSLISQTDVLCYGDCTGDATINVSGGTSPYTYTWSNNDNTPYADSLCAGTYTVTVVDFSNCTAITSVTITEPAQISVTMNVTDVACYGNCDGMIDAIAAGGVLPYSYEWSSGGLTNTETNLCEGSYYLSVTDANGCIYVDSAYVNQPAELTGTINSTDVTCYNYCDGTADIIMSGGTVPYIYNWSTTETTSSITGLCEGDYTVTVTDINACIFIDTVTIYQPDSLYLVLSSTDDHGTGDGTATVVVFGGTIPYSYNWSTGGTDTTITNLTAGSYYITVSDANGCVVDDSVSVLLNTYVNNFEKIGVVLIYPNPAKGQVYITGKNINDNLYIELYDINGKQILRKEYVPVNGLINKQLQLESLSDGMYYIKIMYNNTIKTEKLLVK
ncbi:MAG: hypothetical protein Kow0068_11880 [Marinilabiliales bacterium]